MQEPDSMADLLGMRDLNLPQVMIRLDKGPLHHIILQDSAKSIDTATALIMPAHSQRAPRRCRVASIPEGPDHHPRPEVIAHYIILDTAPLQVYQGRGRSLAQLPDPWKVHHHTKP